MPAMRYALAIVLSTICHRQAHADRSRHLSSDDFARGAAIVPYTLPWWHPEIQWIAVNEIPGPSDHPLLDDNAEFQRFVRANTDESHRFFDGRRGYIQRPEGLPRGHPNCDDYFIYEEIPVDALPTVHFDHPDIHEAYLNGERLPQGHPSASGLLRKVLPDGHPDVDDLFLDHEELPSWHPDLSLVLNDNPIEPIFVFSGHPDLNKDYEFGDPVDDHPSVHHLFVPHLPDSHPHIDDLMEEGYTLPSWHPDISTIVRPRSLVTSPGSILGFAVGALLLVITLTRNITKWRNSKRTTEMILTKNTAGDTSSNSDYDSKSQDGCADELPGPGHDQTRHLAMVMRRDRDINLNPNEERMLVYKEKKSNWKRIFGRRIVKSGHSTGEAMFCLLYVLINLAALWISPTYAFGVGFGSLSAGNTLFTFITATRNSVLTWFIGIAFDQVLVYHRFVGRLTIVFALIHSGFYINDVFEKTSDPVTLTGLISLGCSFVIVLTSLNYVRRKFWNVFFWSHFSFAGFLVGLYLHASSARPFIVTAIACYCIDKGLQMMRKLPRRTTVFEKVDDRTVHVQFAKTSLSSLLGRHKVGQYVFVNFPSLSLLEWHPFSVASGPSDPQIDLYIRGLGDHTNKIVEYSERCAAENKEVKIRSDGPYGTLPFNYRRYGSILFVGGGIGITPIISVLKDIYHAGTDLKKKMPSHCIKNVSLVWIMPHASEATLFLDLLNSFHLKSLEDPLVPDLKLSIHVTRDSEDAMIIGQQIVYSKPQFNAVMDECVENMPEGQTSILVYACGPGGLVNQLWDASMKKKSKKVRVDFYHETFEF
mmetsp:Transcript_20159/g.43790  ORF Transcript_20159/g.43790 Transcript_20159/m.43790 type:complete len:817 (+) Transcript_20159:888-3338(+)|eukprot:CAMPEP_0172322830 /NCGR_PEP_ID=MMETSP1058-20130122/47015_1 /TAXON_ID=83371 /ORGANISM="Detonula confervacea, Strain CCMP 353" /LENGTH=816 /DNA_ID=CAMNT_0013038677 /DNA_START=882 /DNA_END=3332 /DNA_ORIENTATION=-